MYNGEDAKEAFLSSLIAINEKYNPKQDEFVCNYENMSLCKGQFKINITPEAVKSWLMVIEMAIPIIEKIMDLIGVYLGHLNCD